MLVPQERVHRIADADRVAGLAQRGDRAPNQGATPGAGHRVRWPDSALGKSPLTANRGTVSTYGLVLSRPGICRLPIGRYYQPPLPQ